MLRIEVKGLSGENVFVEITPNEYKKMNDYQESYRLCVVPDCLASPIIHVFSYSSEKNTWLNEDGDELIIDQLISAKCYV